LSFMSSLSTPYYILSLHDALPISLQITKQFLYTTDISNSSMLICLVRREKPDEKKSFINSSRYNDWIYYDYACYFIEWVTVRSSNIFRYCSGFHCHWWVSWSVVYKFYIQTDEKCYKSIRRKF